MNALPPGWEADYDGARWFYTYLPTGCAQYHFPREGDEFPDLSGATFPIPQDVIKEELNAAALQAERSRYPELWDGKDETQVWRDHFELHDSPRVSEVDISPEFDPDHHDSQKLPVEDRTGELQNELDGSGRRAELPSTNSVVHDLSSSQEQGPFSSELDGQPRFEMSTSPLGQFAELQDQFSEPPALHVLPAELPDRSVRMALIQAAMSGLDLYANELPDHDPIEPRARKTRSVAMFELAGDFEPYRAYPKGHVFRAPERPVDPSVKRSATLGGRTNTATEPPSSSDPNIRPRSRSEMKLSPAQLSHAREGLNTPRASTPGSLPYPSTAISETFDTSKLPRHFSEPEIHPPAISGWPYTYRLASVLTEDTQEDQARYDQTKRPVSASPPHPNIPELPSATPLLLVPDSASQPQGQQHARHHRRVKSAINLRSATHPPLPLAPAQNAFWLKGWPSWSEEAKREEMRCHAGARAANRMTNAGDDSDGGRVQMAFKAGDAFMVLRQVP